MTLSAWIKQYVFTPLSFAVRGKPAWALLWLAVAMALCGLWHGAAWTFVLWGLWHGALLILNRTLLRPLFAGLEPARSRPPAWRRISAHAFTLVAVFAGWLLFRAQSIEQVVDMASAVLTLRGGLRPALVRENAVFVVGLLVVGLMLLQALRPISEDIGSRLAARPVLRTCVTSVVACAAIILIIAFDRESRAFVYFQF